MRTVPFKMSALAFGRFICIQFIPFYIRIHNVDLFDLNIKIFTALCIHPSIYPFIHLKKLQRNETKPKNYFEKRTEIKDTQRILKNNNVATKKIDSQFSHHE